MRLRLVLCMAMALAASPVAGQEWRMPVVGFLRSTPPEPFGRGLTALAHGRLRRLSPAFLYGALKRPCA